MSVFKSKLGLKAALCWATLHFRKDEGLDAVYEDFMSDCCYYLSVSGIPVDEAHLENYLENYVWYSKKVIDSGFIGECYALDCNPFLTVFEYDLLDLEDFD